MTVEFRCASPKQNRLVLSNMPTPNGVTSVFFEKGLYMTTDKDSVATIMRSEPFRRGTIKLHTPEEEVSRWLENEEEPSYITQEWVDKLSNSAVIAIGKVAKVNSKAPALIRMELVDLPLTTKVQDIAKAFIDEESTEVVVPKTEEEIVEHVETLNTLDEVDVLIQNGVVIREGPWYKDVQTGTSIGRNKESVLKWLESKE